MGVDVDARDQHQHRGESSTVPGPVFVPVRARAYRKKGSGRLLIVDAFNDGSEDFSVMPFQGFAVRIVFRLPR